jgi:hypothetical protein
MKKSSSFKRVVVAVSCALACGASVAAGGGAAVGVWEWMPVANSGDAVSFTKTSFVVVNERLTKPTTFTALTVDDDGGAAQCCIQVDDLTEVKLGALIKKYERDPDFADHFRSIKGLGHIYEAKIVPSAHGDVGMPDFATLKNNHDPADGAPYSAAIVAGKLTGADEVPAKFTLDGHDYTVSSEPAKPDTGLIYRFTVDGRSVTFSEDYFPD